MLPRLISHRFLYMHSYPLSLWTLFTSLLFSHSSSTNIPHLRAAAAGDPLSWMYFSSGRQTQPEHTVCAFFRTLASEPRLSRDLGRSPCRPLAPSPSPRVCSCFLSLLPSLLLEDDHWRLRKILPSSSPSSLRHLRRLCSVPRHTLCGGKEGRREGERGARVARGRSVTHQVDSSLPKEEREKIVALSLSQPHSSG